MCWGWIDNTPLWVLVSDRLGNDSVLQTDGQNFLHWLSGPVFYFSQVFDGEGPKEKKNTCKGQSGAMTAVPPKMVPWQALPPEEG